MKKAPPPIRRGRVFCKSSSRLYINLAKWYAVNVDGALTCELRPRKSGIRGTPIPRINSAILPHRRAAPGPHRSGRGVFFAFGSPHIYGEPNPVGAPPRPRPAALAGRTLGIAAALAAIRPAALAGSASGAAARSAPRARSPRRRRRRAHPYVAHIRGVRYPYL